MLALRAVRSFTLELEVDGPPGARSYSSGGVVSGRVVLELRRASPVRSLTALGRGGAQAHWLESRTVGMYNDYTSRVTYFRRRQHLIRGHLALMCCVETLERPRDQICQHGHLCVLTLNTRPLASDPFT